MTAAAIPFNPPTHRIRQRVQQAFMLIAIVALAILVRAHYAPSPGFAPDLRSFAGWMRVIQTEGVLNFYEPDNRLHERDRTYPPLSTAAFALLANAYGTVGNERLELMRPNFVALLKVLPIAAEIVMIIAVYVWLTPQPFLQRAISTALALYPALIVVSGWWGQYDSTFTVCLVLSLICLNKDRPLWAWGCFALALLVKQPALFFAPLILVITFRRYGWRKTAAGIGFCAVLCLIAFAPFVLNSGVEIGLSPYLQAGDTFPYLTNNAYNTWYIVASGITNGEQVTFSDPAIADAQILFVGITYKVVGLIVFAGFILFLMVVMWRQADQRREFIWAAALYFGFFMLPTQVHERYLYPAAVFSLIAVTQDKRLWWIALGVLLTFTYNIMAVLDEGLMRDLILPPADVGVTAGVVNVVLFAALVGYTMFPFPPAENRQNPV